MKVSNNPQRKVDPNRDSDDSKKKMNNSRRAGSNSPKKGSSSYQRKGSNSQKMGSDGLQRKGSDSSKNGSGRALTNFWKKSPSTKLPGTIKQIGGIKFPPLTTFPKTSPLQRMRNLQKGNASPSRSTSGSKTTRTSLSPITTATTTTIAIDTENKELISESENVTTVKSTTKPKGGLSLKQQKFEKLLREENVDLKVLRKESWHGVPSQIRGTVWQLLLGYIPPNLIRRDAMLQKRREEYNIILERHYSNLNLDNDVILKQIRVDTPRTSPDRRFFQHPLVQKSLERILYLWAVRHPASGYVQGINDLATPFYMVFLAELTGKPINEYVTEKSANDLTKDQLLIVEADCFWCLSLVLDAIQDHYTFAQPGLQKMVFKLQELINRIDSTLHDHIVNQEVQFIQFAFRWMNCLLMREISLPLVIRSWDTCLSEENGSGFKVFHVYICAAFLMRWEKELKTMEFQDLVMFLQSLPTKDWNEKEIEMLLAQAFQYQTYYQDSPNHLR